MKDLKIILYFIIGIGTAVGGYYLYRHLHKFTDKKLALTYIVSQLPKIQPETLTLFEDAFILSWANALFAHENTFDVMKDNVIYRYDVYTGAIKSTA